MKSWIVETPRLRIASNDFEGMQSLCRSTSDEEMKQAYQDMIDEMRRSPGREEWGCEWTIFLRDSNIPIGGICFK